MVGSKGAEKAEEGKKRRRRKRALADPNAPRRPDSGYIRFFKKIKEEWEWQELTGQGEWSGPGSVAVIAGRWSALAAEEKAAFLAAAEEDRAAWKTATKAYLASDAHKAWKAQQAPENPESSSGGQEAEFGALGPGRLAVFSPEFLAHSGEREAELRRLTVAVRRAEEEAAALATRAAAVPGAVAAFRAQTARAKEAGQAATAVLTATQRALVTALTAVPDPDTGRPPSAGGLAAYLEALSSAAANGANPELQRQLHKALAGVKLS